MLDMYFFIVLLVKRMLAIIFDTAIAKAPCIKLKGILITEAPKPYKKPSKRKYPATIISSEQRALITKPKGLFRSFEKSLNIQKQAIAIIALMISVVGAYITYPSNKSERAAPIPAQIALIGPNIQAARRTKASPRFMYPKAGIGIAMKYVATKIKAVKTEESDIVCMCFFFIKILQKVI